MNDGIGLAEVLLGLPGFRVLDVIESDVEVVIAVETTAVWAACRTLRGARRGAGSDACRRARSGVLRAAGAAGVDRSGGGAAGSRCVRRGRGPRTPSMSTRRRC